MSNVDPKAKTWLPYVLPIMSFLVLVEISGRAHDDYAAAMLAIRVLVPSLAMLFFWSRGEYKELRFSITKMTIADIVLGVLLAAMWIVPFVLFPAIRPDPDATAFNPAMAGQAWVPMILCLRMLGYAVVTPPMEELFMRSFLMRFVEAPEGNSDFHDIPIARFTWKSFLIVTLVFLATHAMWEWWVMLPWAVITSLWFYYRKDLFSLIVVHASTNATILLSAIFLSAWFPDGNGATLPLWFLV